jgi:hypothetical protein
VEGKGGGGEVGREVTDKTALHAGRIHLCSLMTQKLGSLLLTYAQPCPILEWYHVHTLDKIHVIRVFFLRNSGSPRTTADRELGCTLVSTRREITPASSSSSRRAA